MKPTCGGRVGAARAWLITANVAADSPLDAAFTFSSAPAGAAGPRRRCASKPCVGALLTTSAAPGTAIDRTSTTAAGVAGRSRCRRRNRLSASGST